MNSMSNTFEWNVNLKAQMVGQILGSLEVSVEVL